MNNDKKVLVTGITGFIGSNLVKKMISHGWNVEAIVRRGSHIELLSQDIRESVVFHEYGDNNTLATIVSMARPQVVIHLASLFLSRHEPNDVGPLLDSNVVFGTHLLEAMSRYGVKNFINTGTAWQHYQNAAYSPVNLYAATKEAFGNILQYYEEGHDIHAITLQLSDTYGEGDRRKKVFQLLREAADSGIPLEMSPGEQLIDCVHVDDVTDAFIMAADYLLSKQYELCGTYAVSAGKAISLRELVTRYEKIIGKPIPVMWGKRKYRPREVMQPWNKGKLLPGWGRKHRELM